MPGSTPAAYSTPSGKVLSGIYAPIRNPMTVPRMTFRPVKPPSVRIKPHKNTISVVEENTDKKTVNAEADATGGEIAALSIERETPEGNAFDEFLDALSNK